MRKLFLMAFLIVYKNACLPILIVRLDFEAIVLATLTLHCLILI